MNPHNILLIKSHSMGIGDVLRSSAAWQALKLRWPNAKLHLLFLSRHPGYPTEQLIREHHLLESAHFITVTTDVPGFVASQRLPRSVVYAAIDEVLKGIPIDLIVDFEPGGMRTTLLTWRLAHEKKAESVGIAQFPLRRCFYDHAAPSVRAYCKRKNLPLLMDYTEKDFVALVALGIDRKDNNINLRVSQAGLAWQKEHLSSQDDLFTVTLNIGCGTNGALPKRPPMAALIDCMVALYRARPFRLNLSGADFEATVNADFRRDFSMALGEQGMCCEVKDWAGRCSLSQLTGLLGASGLVISSDSGPYHMAVALGVPTVCWFNFDTPPSYHRQKGVAVAINPSPDDFVDAVRRVLELA
ncbi:glycosyltransferase family 9 protein [Rhodoferax sp.]|uniref:glycosyltransferase family 9 protein n=1 Tax=Rhodoferax sp. TaxID=50421 RepID=UPI0028520FAF|nr:glycosyltransferase family 9 protein [Rhodoferax sp.]MDR3370195.1 glycosyltransferase family 9 protein [Rhodoferax sp.]